MTDPEFLAAFEHGELAANGFRHRDHIRLAYLYLERLPVDGAVRSVQAGLHEILRRAGAPLAHYHETLTRAWLLAVRHFMDRVGPQGGSEAFMNRCPTLLDKRIMATHYSAAALGTPDAREHFVPPDLEPIPGDR